jgi:hypothetical protein
MKLARVAFIFMSIMALAGCGDDSDEQPALGRLDGGVDAVASSCDPVVQNCPAGQQCVGGCGVVGVMAQVFVCAVPSPGATATNGQDCGAGCAPGHDCFTVTDAGGTRNLCRKYCNSDADCPNGSCTTVGLVCTETETPIGRLCAL